VTIITAITTLFFVMDPLGNVPVFISILKDVPAERRTPILRRELIVALGILLFMLFFGRYFLEWLGINRPALSIAGGIILFMISIKMIFPMREDGFSDNPDGEPFIVPLAVPLIVGPSTMSIVIIMSMREPEKMLQWTLATVIAWLLNTIILLFSFKIYRFLGDRAMIGITRLMGMILTTISVQMFMDGVAKFLAK
jgi:MarC family membrane protein